MGVNNHRFRTAIIANLRASPAKSAILFIGCGVLIFVIVRQFVGKPDAADASVDAIVAAAEPEAASVAPKPQLRPLPEMARTLLRDPFQMNWLKNGKAPATEEPAPSEDKMVLQFTMMDEAGRIDVAVISGVIVERGTLIGGYVVEEIGKRHAVLRGASDTIKLEME